MISSALLLLCPIAAPAPLLAQNQVLTLEQASGRSQAPSFGSRASNWEWASDGHHLVTGGRDQRRYFDPETLQEVEAIPMGLPDPPRGLTRDQIHGALASLDGIDAEKADRLAGGRSQRSADEHTVVIVDGAQLLVVLQRGERVSAHRITTEGPRPELVRLSDTGNSIAWVAGNDLFLVDSQAGKVIRVTDNGGKEYFNGKLDWVYQEEIYGRGNFLAHWWSPDGKYLAFLALDESPVYDFTVIDHIEADNFRVKPEITNYPKAGDPNPKVRLGIADANHGRVHWVDLSEYQDQLPLLTQVGWTPDSKHCLFVVADRVQTFAHLRRVAPGKSKSQLLIAEQAESGWTNRPPLPRWLADGSFLWESERTGYRHLYHYRADGTLIKPLTSGQWNVTNIHDLDQDAGLLWFGATRDGAINQNLYRIDLDGSGLVRLTQGDGSHSTQFRDDRAFFVDRVSSLTMPEEVRLCDAEGKVLKVLERSSVPAAEEFRFATWELHEVPARDGTPLDVAVLKPVPFDPNQKYPVWLPTYSGPNAPTVRNRWNGSAWYQFLAEQGIIVLQVNVNTASGKGMWSTSRCYQQLGVRELRDLEDAVDWLCAAPWADGERVGITGYSYGGFMTAYALLNSDRFRLGIAGGGVYDWRMYDSVYTERYMNTPQANPNGYARSSCLNKAAQLHGFLHMHHGVMDDNVHLQNLMHMSEALQKAGKTNWSMMLYPQNRHGIRDRDQAWHARQIEWQLIQQHLQPVGAPGPR